jgi:hypothetical protein
MVPLDWIQKKIPYRGRQECMYYNEFLLLLTTRLHKTVRPVSKAPTLNNPKNSEVQNSKTNSPSDPGHSVRNRNPCGFWLLLIWRLSARVLILPPAASRWPRVFVSNPFSWSPASPRPYRLPWNGYAYHPATCTRMKADRLFWDIK